MMSLFEAAWVIARRDFVASVFSRTFILFLLAPMILFAVPMRTIDHHPLVEPKPREPARHVVHVGRVEIRTRVLPATKDDVAGVVA